MRVASRKMLRSKLVKRGDKGQTNVKKHRVLQTNTNIHLHTHTHTHSPTHSPTNTHTHTPHTHLHTHTHTPHTHHTHTHTHTHTHVLVINQLNAQIETVLPQPVHRTATYRCDDTRCCIIQF